MSQLRYYPYSCVRVERACRAAFAEELRPVQLSSRKIGILMSENLAMKEAYKGLLVQHILWMLAHLQNVGAVQSVATRGVWIGWVYACCEWMGLLTHRQVRGMARRDLRDGRV